MVNFEGFAGQLNVKPQPVVVEEIGCMAGNEEPFEGTNT